jgi:hypothetical protein
LSRKIGFSPTSEATDITLPDPESDKIIGWNNAADGMENYDNPKTYSDLAKGYSNSALSSKNSANQSETWSRKWAINPEDVAVSGGEYSSKHWALKAQATLDSLTVRQYEMTTTATTQLFNLPFTVNPSLGNVVVYINGVRQYPSNYTIASETVIFLDESVPADTNMLFLSTEAEAGFLNQIPQPSAGSIGRLIQSNPSENKYEFANPALSVNDKNKLFVVNTDASGYTVLSEAPSANAGRYLRVKSDGLGYEHASAFINSLKTVTTSANAYAGDCVLADATTGNLVILLYANDGERSTITVKKIDAGAGEVRCKAVIGDIDNASVYTINTAYDKSTFIFDGSDWWSI